jgi:hypothetical protein
MKRGFLFAGIVGGLLLFGLLVCRKLPLVRHPQTKAPATIALPGSNSLHAGVTHPAATANSAPAQATKTVPATNLNEADFAAFANWAQRRLTNDATATSLQGEALAWKRRQALLELMELDTARALALAVPFQWRRALPENVTRHFEQWIDARGDYEMALAESQTNGREIVYRWVLLGEKRYRAFVYGRRLTQISQRNIPLHGIALADKIALTAAPIRFLEAAEATALEQARGHTKENSCAACGMTLSADQTEWIGDIGGETRYFCSAAHAELANDNLTIAAFGGSGGTTDLAAGGSSAWTQGRKDVLYIRVNFPDDLTEPNSESAAYSTMESVNEFYVENSYNQMWLDTTVTPLLTLPQIKAWYATAGPGALLSDARKVARKAGYDTANYDRDIVSHTSVPGYDWGGLGVVGGKGTWLQSYGAGVTAHELGHNQGLGHANFWNPDATYTGIYGTGTNIEYGNIFDTMGSGGSHFCALFKHQLDWLPDTTIHTITTNGVYRLYPFDTTTRTSGRCYAAHVHKDFERDYWLEFRNRFPGNTSLQNGILLNWSPWSGGGGAQLLDSLPATDSRTDSAVVIGRTFSDRLAGVHITPIARGATGTEPWIEVRVNFDDNSARNIPCCVKIEVTPTNAAPGQLVRFHATVADRDDDSFAYAWSFDDGTFSTNNRAWTYKSWAAAGEHVVRCEVSDMRGGRASANTLVTVGAPSAFHVTGVVLDENGEPLEDVFVNSGYTNANGPVVGFTDSDGAFVLAGLDGSVDLSAAKYGYTFEPVGWVNSQFIVTNVAGLNFVARSLTNITLSLTTNLVWENDATPYELALTRSGDTNNDLSVVIFVAGSASVPGDLDFTPPLVAGSNNVVIPAGTNRIVFNFAPVNNGLVEATEQVYVTVRETAEYIVAPPAEGRITIRDDDQLATPIITVAALDGPVLENGMNTAGFVFTRTGSITAALPVTYAIGGTATAGMDYATLLGTVIIPAGSASATVALQVFDDKNVEPNETVSVTINASPTYTIATAAAQASILDDDVLVVTVSPTDSGLAEPGSSGRFTVQRDGDQSVGLVVNYTLTGSASNGVDYTSPSGTVTIPAGETSAEVVITALNDALLEGDETVTLVLATNAAYDIGTPGSATLLLRDDEKVTVTVSAPDDEAAEPGDDFGTFRISRSGSTSGILTVPLLINGTALAGSDYVPLENPVVIPDGSSSVDVTLIPFEDLFWESSTETVIITLAPGNNYNIGTPRDATVNILDNESYGTPAIGFTFPSFAAPENESPGLPVSLSHTSTAPVTVQYQVIGGTATSGTDYTLAPGTLEFAPGEWAKSIPLPISNDTLSESDETIRVTLFNPVGAAHDGIQIMIYTIQDDDTASVSVTATAATASEIGPVASNFRITRSGSTATNQVVNFQITGTASLPSDSAALGTSVIIPAGQTFVDLPVVPVNDATVELDEDLTLTLIGAPGGKIVAPNTATITILDANTNGLPVVRLSATNQPNVVEGGVSSAFTLTRIGATNNDLTVYLATSGSASGGADYTALPGSVVIPAGQFSVNLPVAPVDDPTVEGDETIIVSITARDTYRVAAPGTAQMTLQDNDQTVRLDASDFEATESASPPDPGEFTFTRFGTTNTPLQVFFTISGSAGNGADYIALSNSFTIPAGSLTATLPISPLNDGLFEGRETVTLTLQANAAYALTTATNATVTIRDDEPTVSLTANLLAIPEATPVPGIITVSRDGDLEREFTGHLSVGGTATFGVDYPAFETNILFTCGITAVDLLIFPTNEAQPGIEFISVTLLPDAAYTRSTLTNLYLTIVEADWNHEPAVTITSPRTNLIFLLQTNANLILEATVTDADNDPVNLTWSKVSGPEEFAFGDSATNNTTVSLTNSGVYVLRLTADDGVLTNYAEVTVVVGVLARLTNNPQGEELLHWTFDEGFGADVFDVSGHERHGTIQGPLGWVYSGINGGALALDGTNNFVQAVNDAGFLNGLKRFTLSCWVKPDAVPATQGLFTADDSGLNPTLSLAMRSAASCGSATNVLESTLATSCDDARQVTAANAITNGWQHIVLTWSNGLPPALYINGQLDQRDRHKAPLRGELVNCPQFLLGKGPVDVTATWAGLVDDLRVFSWQMSEAEVNSFVATNFGPIIEVATNLTVPVVLPVELSGVVTDDGQPVPPGNVTVTWRQLGGPLPVTIANTNALTNIVAFTQAGDYVFRLIADDGQVKVYADLPVNVVEPAQVSAVTSDPAAAELGPDTGEFTFTRAGDLNYELTVYFTQTGTASNGVDFIPIALSNHITFGIGEDTRIFTITPYLDHRTEGDETLTITLTSNVFYTISSGQATVTIQDSPYGQWNIAHFTLEELTDPLLSGEGIDHDDDGLVNFAEYAANRDPQTGETNSPLQTTIELNPGDGLNHINLTYQRRLAPTDVAYRVAVSTNLMNWTTGAAAAEEISTTPDPNGVTETVKARVLWPWPTVGPQFITLQVWLLATGP